MDTQEFRIPSSFFHGHDSQTWQTVPRPIAEALIDSSSEFQVGDNKTLYGTIIIGWGDEPPERVQDRTQPTTLLVSVTVEIWHRVGRGPAVIATSSDVTEKLAAQKALRIAAQKFKQYFHNRTPTWLIKLRDQQFNQRFA